MCVHVHACVCMYICVCMRMRACLCMYECVCVYNNNRVNCYGLLILKKCNEYGYRSSGYLPLIYGIEITALLGYFKCGCMFY